MLLSILIALLMTVAALVFAFQNAGPAQVSFLVWHFQSSLALVLVVSFGAGLASGVLLVLPGRIRTGFVAGRQKRELATLNRRLEECQAKLEEAESRGGTPPAGDASETSGQGHPG